MTDSDCDDKGAAAPLTAGQRLVIALRAARIAQRPDLRAGLKATRAGLQAERRERLANWGPRRAAPPPLPGPVAPAANPPPDVAEPGCAPEQAGPAPHSMFAHLMTSAEAALQDAAAAHADQPAEPHSSPQPTPGSEPSPDTAPQSGAAAAMASAPSQPAQSQPAPSASPPVATLGFGPGMTTRFHQVGIATVADLAGADAAGLREALGDVSRLINIDAWICTARTVQDTAGQGRAETA